MFTKTFTFFEQMLLNETSGLCQNDDLTLRNALSKKSDPTPGKTKRNNRKSLASLIALKSTALAHFRRYCVGKTDCHLKRK